MRPLILLVALVLGGCVTARWTSAQNEDVDVNGATYRVSWLKVDSGQIDFRAHRNEFIVVGPDAITEKVAITQAMTSVGRRLCPSGKLTIENETREGAMHFARGRCVS